VCDGSSKRVMVTSAHVMRSCRREPVPCSHGHGHSHGHHRLSFLIPLARRPPTVGRTE